VPPRPQPAGEGIQAIVYDGAFRGVHHQTLMRELGVIVDRRSHHGGVPGHRTACDRSVSAASLAHTGVRAAYDHHGGAIEIAVAMLGHRNLNRVAERIGIG
jgi:hypothetical protein